MTCPDCSREVSTAAVACPGCARPIAVSPQGHAPDGVELSSGVVAGVKIGIGAFVVLPVLLVAAWFLVAVSIALPGLAVPVIAGVTVAGWLLYDHYKRRRK